MKIQVCIYLIVGLRSTKPPTLLFHIQKNFKFNFFMCIFDYIRNLINSKKMEVSKKQENWMQTPPNLPYFKVDPVVVLILGIVTCGLYLIYWNLKAAEVVNAVNNKQVISPLVAILTACCGLNLFYYWLMGRDGLPKVYELTNQPQKDEAVLLLLLGFFFPMVAAMIVQTELNKLYH